MKNKKSQLASVIVTVVVLAIIFVVVLRFYASILALIKAIGEDYFWCLMKKVISAYTKLPAGIEVWGSFCPPVIKTIKLEQKGENSIPIDIPISKTELKNLQKWYPGEDFQKTDFYLKYRLDKAIAEGMRKCWGRNGEGKLPIGKEWNSRFWGSPKEPIFYCDLCAIYKFDSNVQEEFNKKSPLSLKEFLKRNPVRPGSSESFWEYLQDKDGVITDFKDIIYSTNADLAIVYVRGNKNNFVEFWRDVLDIAPWYGEENHPIPIDMVDIISYEKYGERCLT